MPLNVGGLMDVETKTVQAELPAGILKQMQSLVNEGWFEDINDLILDALRRFLESHRPELMEHHVLRDVEWGLYGEGRHAPSSGCHAADR